MPPERSFAEADISTGIERVGEIEYTLDKLDLSKIEDSKTDEEGRMMYKVWLTLDIRMSDEAGLLVFRVLHNGEECGKAKLGFSYT